METWEWLLMILAGTVVAALTIDFLGSMNIPVSFFLLGTIILTVWESENVIRILQNKSHKLIATNFSTSSNGEYIPAGDYAIFTCGDIDYALNIKGSKGAIIGPRDAVNKLGANTALTINPNIVNPNELPPEVKKKLTDYGITPPYMFGRISHRQGLAEPDVQRLTMELTEKDTLLNTLQDVSRGKFQTFEDVVEFMKRTRKSLDDDKGFMGMFGARREERDKEKQQDIY